jgi:acyl-CoA reductase-like NAD-dependent aldehyde dehydrogenase
VYGLAAAVFSKDINRALTTAHKLQAGTAWVCLVSVLASPFGSYMRCTGQLRQSAPCECAFRRCVLSFSFFAPLY